METTVSEKELKALSLSFRSTASRFLKGSCQDAIDNLRRLLEVMDGTPLLAEFIEKNQAGPYDMAEITAKRTWRSRYPVPTSSREEVAFTYQLLKYILSNADSRQDIYHYVHGYHGSGSSIERDFEAFSHSVVLPFINHMIRYLEGLMEDIRKPDQGKVTVNNFGSMGQVNVSQDSSTMAATNNQSGTTNVIQETGTRLLRELETPEVPDDVKGDLREATELAMKQAASDRPDNTVLSMCGKVISGAIKNVPATLAAAKAGKELVDLIAQWLKST